MFRVALLSPLSSVPVRASPGDAGYDVTSVQAVTIPPGARAVVRTGFAIQVPPDCYARVAPRSGLAVKAGIDVLAGVVDSSYRGEVCVVLVNHGTEPFVIDYGDRIAQLIFERIYVPPMLLVVDKEELTNSARGEGGFGSTGQ